ncbi:uncharacterized protein LOC110263415 [Arachis ipaensis]|uniref:uncharacterized protein LOC110263415 n=1 Tax=Arachis ipaensis TaxID=130454 RepID=UPI000A2B0F5E|nr:uncharacterized protein LOC110263415 [Arachis ipaensis]
MLLRKEMKKSKPDFITDLNKSCLSTDVDRLTYSVLPPDNGIGEVGLDFALAQVNGLWQLLHIAFAKRPIFMTRTYMFVHYDHKDSVQFFNTFILNFYGNRNNYVPLRGLEEGGTVKDLGFKLYYFCIFFQFLVLEFELEIYFVSEY